MLNNRLDHIELFSNNRGDLMKKIISNMKPFLIFQSFVIGITILFVLLAPGTDLWFILGYGVIAARYAGVF